MKKPAHASPAAGEATVLAQGGQRIRLSDPAMAQSVSELKDRLSQDPRLAAQLLRNAGIVTRTGRLAKTFGG